MAFWGLLNIIGLANKHAVYTCGSYQVFIEVKRIQFIIQTKFHWINVSPSPAIVYLCIVEMFYGINFRPCSQGHCRLYVIINTGQKIHGDKHFTYESRAYQVLIVQ